VRQALPHLSSNMPTHPPTLDRRRYHSELGAGMTARRYVKIPAVRQMTSNLGNHPQELAYLPYRSPKYYRHISPQVALPKALEQISTP
jgi:hypothetical protein